MYQNQKIISLLLALSLLLGCLPGCASGRESTPTTEVTVPPTTESTVPPTTVPETEPPTEATEAPTEPEEKDFSTVPLYFQTDYPDKMYGVGTIATSGCSIVCLAMVASYLTEHEYLPDELARYFGGTAENNIARLEKGSRDMQLPFRKTENVHKTLQGVKDGQVAIVLMGSNSMFTTSQHFIVITGVTEDGRYTVNDPLPDNYYKWDLREGFEKGFTTGQLTAGYSGGWLYDKSAMPEDPFIYYKPEPVRGEPRYPDIELSDADRELLARVIWAEARGESLEGQQAVAEVIINRLASPRFPNTVQGIVFSQGQFKSVPYLKDAQPYQAQYEAIENALLGPYILPEDVVFFAGFAVNDNIWGVIGGHVFCYDALWKPEDEVQQPSTEPAASEP